MGVGQIQTSPQIVNERWPSSMRKT